jgi:hypothetical protein
MTLAGINTLNWLDFGAAEQRKAVQLLDQLRDHDTVDELGLGAIRDAFADRLFPGASTIQTRARYFLIVPWIYRTLEDREVPSAEIGRRARAEEVKVIRSLAPVGQRQGVIGIDAQERLKRFPSSIYWAGLETWGIRHFEGSQRQYHASLDRFYRDRRATSQAREDDPAQDRVPPNWDPGLPDRPAAIDTLELSKGEAQYLKERIEFSVPTSMLAVLVRSSETPIDIAAPWDHPATARLPHDLAEDLAHARNFSDVGWVATLVYQLILARLASQEPGELGDLAVDKREALEEMLDEAVSQLRVRGEALKGWTRQLFWHRPQLRLASAAAGRTATFLDAWLRIIGEVLEGAEPDMPSAIQLISDREIALKGALARVRNPEALRKWVEQSVPMPMDYRWSATVRTLVLDIREGLAR